MPGPVAERRPAVPRPGRASYRRESRGPSPLQAPSDRPCGELRIVTVIIPILAPLPHVPVHIIQPPGVRLLLAHRMRLAVRVARIPGVLAKPSLIVAEAILRRASGPTGIFPLGFAGQLELSRLPGRFAFSLSRNCWQSSQLTCSTGLFGPLKLLGLLPITASHCSCVTRYLPR